MVGLLRFIGLMFLDFRVYGVEGLRFIKSSSRFSGFVGKEVGTS